MVFLCHLMLHGISMSTRLHWASHLEAPVSNGCFNMLTVAWHASTLAWSGVILGPTMPPGSMRVP